MPKFSSLANVLTCLLLPIQPSYSHGLVVGSNPNSNQANKHRDLKATHQLISPDNWRYSGERSKQVTWPSGEVHSRYELERECLSYLRQNLMLYDLPNVGSLGFAKNTTGESNIDRLRDGVQKQAGSGHSSDAEVKLGQTDRRTLLSKQMPQLSEARVFQEGVGSTSEVRLPDGLSNGLVGPTVLLSILAKESFPWTVHIPKDIYYEYVLSFASINEGRSNWRPLLYDALKPYLDDLLQINNNPSVQEVVMAVNRHLWCCPHITFGRSTSIQFKSGQTPLIYDPMSVMAFGYASCTGISILLICALRSVGIPCRLAGTPAWHGDPEDGNHSWVEIWTEDGTWKITEGKPAWGGKQENDVGSLNNPCDYWFCHPERYADGKTKVYAARLRWIDGKGRNSRGGHFPMAWDVDNYGVPSEDRTKAMHDMCSQC